MLTCKDIMLVKNQKNEVIAYKVYDRIYFDFGPNDPTEEKAVTANDKPVEVEGKPFSKVVPKNATSVHPAAELAQAAIGYLQTQENAKPKPEDRVDPWLILLGEASTQYDLGVRSKLRQQATPGKPVDMDKATEAFAKKLVAAGKYKTVEEAAAAVKALGL